MNKEQLDAIKGRVANATPGEWIIDNSSDDRPYITDIWFDGEENGHVEIHRYGASAESYDAEFIAHARQDVPTLIAEVERLQKALKNTDADLYVYKDLYNEMTDKNIELIKFLQARITKGWGQKAVDLAMIHIQEQEKDIERLRERVALDFFRCGETTTAFVESVEENKRLQKQHDALVKENKELDAENSRLQQFEKQVQQINNAADRLENGEIDGFDFGEIVLDIL